MEEGNLRPKHIITIEDEEEEEMALDLFEEQLTVNILVARQDVFYDDDQGEEGVESREFSEIIFLRKFNNWIKTVLINKYCDKLIIPNYPSVLDLCSGKGGDLNKWVKRGVSHYVALEFQGSLIDKAMRRLRNFKNIRFPSIFVVQDVGDPNTLIDRVLDNRDLFKNIKKKIVFDLVSCQFSMHYLFETETKLRSFLHNVSCRLEPGGYFIATTVDADKVTALMRTKWRQDLCISNRFYSIRFGQDSYSKLSSGTGCGLKFYFYLKDAVGRDRQSEKGRPVYVPEYLVPMDYLEQIARDEFELELVEKKNLLEFYQENIESNQDLFQKMVAS
jgi:mRNA (guanine-N7-)-methyltransferase